MVTAAELVKGAGRLYKFRTNLKPESTRCITLAPTELTNSVKNRLSIVMICDTFTTESLGKSDCCEDSWTLPGASANLRLVVKATTMTVLIILRLKLLVWTTSTGRRYPGADPCGSFSVAHQISPRFIPISLLIDRPAVIWLKVDQLQIAADLGKPHLRIP